jgi:hypothetical protein
MENREIGMAPGSLWVQGSVKFVVPPIMAEVTKRIGVCRAHADVRRGRTRGYGMQTRDPGINL